VGGIRRVWLEACADSGNVYRTALVSNGAGRDSRCRSMASMALQPPHSANHHDVGRGGAGAGGLCNPLARHIQCTHYRLADSEPMFNIYFLPPEDLRRRRGGHGK
jgi:hypothetical protein